MGLRSALYKGLLTLVFGLLFFVQTQPEFFYCATKNKRADTYINLVKTNSSLGSAFLPWNKNILDNIQLNKRFQSPDFFEILPLLICLLCLLSFVRKPLLRLILHTDDPLLTVKYLRGPPLFHLIMQP